MPVVTKKMLVCDRCGESVEVGECYSGCSLDECPEGWHRIANDRYLCPTCYPGYDLMLARHKVEIEAYFSQSE